MVILLFPFTFHQNTNNYLPYLSQLQQRLPRAGKIERNFLSYFNGMDYRFHAFSSFPLIIIHSIKYITDKFSGTNRLIISWILDLGN